MIKSSRRKQSKPIKVFHGEEGEPNNNKIEDKLEELDGKEQEDMADDDEQSSEEIPIITCSRCPETFPSVEELSVHIKERHVETIQKVFEKEGLTYPYPTEYHRLASELNHPDSYPRLSNGDSERQASPDSGSSMIEYDSKDINSDGSKSATSTKIFHPDAYCKLCDKEFCNKYFLKTHRANKHGIFDSSPPPPSFPATTLPSVLGSMPPEAITPPSFRHDLPMESKTPSEKSVPDVSVTSSSIVKEKDKEKDVSKEMEDFCEHCQKHFCNKYYLKKHKQDVHGITPEPSSSTTKRGRPPCDTQAPPTAVTSSPMFMPQNVPGLPNLPNMPGVMVLNPFLPPVALLPQTLLQQQQLQLPPIFSSPVSLPTVSESATPSTAASPIPNDALRSIGVLNAEAFCEICRKEFCNKYFLKIHKANKHGIFCDDININNMRKNLFGPFFGLDGGMCSPGEIKKEIKQEPLSESPTNGMLSSSDSYMTYCNTCNKEFYSKYAYKIHRMNVHGMLGEDIVLNENGNSDILDVKPENLSSEMDKKSPPVSDDGKLNNGNNNSSTMFSSMIAAKLADRVICDICNKELCNKYFLKAHKLKIHGVETSLDPSPTSSHNKSPLSSLDEPQNLTFNGVLDQQQPLQDEPENLSVTASKEAAKPPTPLSQTMDIIPGPTVEKPANVDLVKLGIDPEAYCEICKKEFCSKYFLRTHKLNIHGIRSEVTTPIKDKSMPLPLSLSLGPEPFSSTLSTSFSSSLSTVLSGNYSSSLPTYLSTPLSSSLPTSLSAHLASQGMPPMPCSLPLSMSNAAVSLSRTLPQELPESTDKSSESYEKCTWRWKEPVNNSRVSCELCNKELCNKYFLRTHKLNKHGIVPSEKSQSSQNNSPTPSDLDTGSNCSNFTDLSDRGAHSPRLQKMDLNNGKALNLSMNSSSKNNKSNDIINLKMKPQEELLSMSNKYYGNSTDICHFCNKSFKNSKWLKLHMRKEHADQRALLTTKSPMFDTNGITGLQTKICQICNVLFPSELSMHLHMIQEHNAQINLKTDTQLNGIEEYRPKRTITLGFGLKRRPAVSSKQRLYNCSRCDFKTKWLSNLQTHEESKHNLQQRNCSCYSCKKCGKAFLSERSLLQHAVATHGVEFDKFDKDSYVKKEPRRFKCVWCCEKFLSRVQTNRHIRDTHIRGDKNFKISKKLHHEKIVCRFCSFSTRYIKQLRNHMIRYHSGRTETVNSNNDNCGIEVTNSGISSLKQNNFLASVVSENNTGYFQMQKFKVKDTVCDGNIIPAVVQLPVKQKVYEPLTITVNLTPMEQ